MERTVDSPDPNSDQGHSAPHALHDIARLPVATRGGDSQRDVCRARAAESLFDTQTPRKVQCASWFFVSCRLSFGDNGAILTTSVDRSTDSSELTSSDSFPVLHWGCVLRRIRLPKPHYPICPFASRTTVGMFQLTCLTEHS